MQKVLGLACAGVLFSINIASSFSKEENNQNIKVLDEVTVVATKSPNKSFDIPGMVTVVNADDPSIANSSTVKTMLSNVPGLNFTGSARRNGQNMVLRGYNTNGLIVLFDGVRQKSESAHDGRFFIDPNLVKTVEVIRGPQSSLYGSGGLGGVISFQTKDAADLLMPGQTKGAMTTLGMATVNQEWMASQSAYAKTDNVDVVASIMSRNSDDITLGGGDNEKLKSKDRILSGMFKLGYKVNEHNLVKLNITSYKNEAREPNNPQSTSNDDLVNKDIISNRVSLAYEYKDPKNKLVNLKAQIYHNDIDIEEKEFASETDLSRRLATIGLNVENQTRLEIGNNFSNIFTYGLEYYEEEQKGSDAFALNGESGGIPDAKTDYSALFIQDEIRIDDLYVLPGSLLVIPGVRSDNYKSSNATGLSLDKNQLSPKFGVTYKPQEWMMLFGNYSRGFRAPSMTEIFTTGTHFSIPFMGSNVFVANPNLRPETNENVEYGFGFNFGDVFEKKDNLNLKFSRFEIESKDFIDTQVNFVMFPTCCGTTTSVNIDKAKLWGHEFEGGYENNLVRIKTGYSYVTGKNEANGQYLTNITPFTVNSDFALKLPEFDSVIGWRSVFAKKQKQVNDQANARDGFVVHNLYYQIQPSKFKNVTLNLGIDNIFDKAYTRVFAGSREPGRNYRAQINYKW